MALKYPALYKYQDEDAIFIALLVSPASFGWLNVGENFDRWAFHTQSDLKYIKEENFICMFPYEKIANILLEQLDKGAADGVEEDI